MFDRAKRKTACILWGHVWSYVPRARCCTKCGKFVRLKEMPDNVHAFGPKDTLSDAPEDCFDKYSEGAPKDWL